MADWKLPVNCKKCRDHLGHEYRSIREMTRAWKVTDFQYYKRLSRGWSPEKALTVPSGGSHPVKDHLGQDFPTLRKMAEHWEVEYQTLLARLKKGWSVEKALTAPLDRRGRKLGDKNGRTTGGPQS